MNWRADNVDQVFRWLSAVFGVWLPTLPLASPYLSLTGLFQLDISGNLPAPTDPLPWTIPLAGSWPLPIAGISVELRDLRIRVAQHQCGRPGAVPAVPASPRHPPTHP